MARTKEPRIRILVLSKRQYTSKDLLDDQYGRVREIPMELARLGHDVIGICFSYRRREEGDFLDQDPGKEGKVLWRSMNLGSTLMPGVLGYMRRAEAIAREFQPHIILSFSDAFHVIYGVRLARRIGAKSVVDLYDNFESFWGTHIPIVRRAFRRAVTEADAVLCISEPLRQLVETRYGRRNRIVVLENGFRPDLFGPRDRIACRRHMDLPLKAKLVGTAGALSRSRDIDTLFKAMDVLARNNTRVHLTIAGPRDGQLNLPHVALVHDLGQLPHEEIPYFFNALDVVVVPNRDSNFGRYCFPQKAYEAIACKVPVVAASVGAMQTLLRDYPENLYAPGDVAGLVEATQTQITDPICPNVKIENWTDIAKRLDTFLVQTKVY